MRPSTQYPDGHTSPSRESNVSSAQVARPAPSAVSAMTLGAGVPTPPGEPSRTSLSRWPTGGFPGRMTSAEMRLPHHRHGVAGEHACLRYQGREAGVPLRAGLDTHVDDREKVGARQFVDHRTADVAAGCADHNVGVGSVWQG